MFPFFATILLAAGSFGHAADPFDVGVLIWSDNIPGQVAMRAGLLAEADRINAAANDKRPPVRLDVKVAGDGTDGIERQIGQMQALIDQGVDIIIVQPTDNAALSRPLQAANGAGIPVVAYDQYILGGKLAAYLTSDNRQAGAQGGEYIAHRFPDDKELKLVIVEYPHVSSTVERLDGFLDALARNGQEFRIMGTYLGVDPTSGELAAKAILADFPEPGSIDVVFTVNDGGGLSVVSALARAGRLEVVVATVDGDPASVDNIREGRLTVIDSAQFCGPLGAEAMKSAYALLLGEAVPHHVLIPTFPITVETLEGYPGWMGPMPERFAKPWPSTEPHWDPTLRVVPPAGAGP